MILQTILISNLAIGQLRDLVFTPSILGPSFTTRASIYTHLIIPAVFTLCGQIWLQTLISRYFPEASLLDRVIFGANLFAATITLSLSTVYHALMNHSMTVSFLCLRIDYIGILALILGSFFSGIFVGFICNPFVQRVYWSMITSLSLLTSVLVFHPRLQGLKYRPRRTIAFPCFDRPFWFCAHFPRTDETRGTGAFFYDMRLPKSTWPGKFDIWGSSYQIFHLLVVVRRTIHMVGVWNAYSWNYVYNRQCILPT